MRLRPLLIIRRVAGHSMLPTLRPGQIVLASGWRRVQPEKIVIARHNGREIIKRVHTVKGDKVFLQGDNPDAAHNAVVTHTDIIAILL